MVEDVSRRYELHDRIPALDIVSYLEIYIVVYAVNELNVVLVVIVDAIEYQGVFFLLGKNSAGHTCEYAQRDIDYQLSAFHECKSTEKICSYKIYPRYFIRIFAFPLSRSFAMLFSRI